MNNNLDIEHWLSKHLALKLGVKSEDIDLDQSLAFYGLDSLHFQELLGDIEKHFSIQLHDELPVDVDSLRSWIELIQDIISANQNSMPTPVAATAPDLLPTYTAAEIQQFNAFDTSAEYQKLKGMQARLGDIFFDQQEGISKDNCIIDGKKRLNFTSYNYLGFTGNKTVIQGAINSIRRYGTSVSASRIVSGEKVIHRELELEIAQLIGTQDALVFTTGHATNVTTIAHLFHSNDLILHDELAHNSLIQGAIFSGATRIVFPHNDHAALDEILKKNRHHYQKVLIIIEGVYSMDGDIPDVPAFIAVKKKHSAWLMIDEAHSMGVLGKSGRGIVEYYNLNAADIEIWMGTLSKSFASCGGYIAGKKELIEYLKYTCPGFIYSVGISPANACAALAAIRLLKSNAEVVDKLNRVSQFARQTALSYGFDIGLNNNTPVLPLIIGNSEKSILLAQACFEQGINIKPIIYPAVAEHKARLRLFITALHKTSQIKTALATIAMLTKKIG